VKSRVRAVLLVVFALAAVAAAATAARWVYQREHAADAAPRQIQAEAVSMHLDDPHARSLPVEMAALGAARFHNQSGHPELALQQLERLRSKVPHGALESERMAELAIAQCALGKRSEAGQTLHELERLAAPAELLARVKNACERAPASAARP
jgi:hypothetical protein